MPVPSSAIDRRELLALSAAFGGSLLAAQAKADAPKVPRKKYAMKKSINLWAFPYPDRMNLEQCLRLAKDAGFDGIELNYDLDNDLSPKSGPKEYAAIRAMAEKVGIAISGLCSFLFWPYPLTSNDPVKRARGIELATKITEAAHELGTENVLVVPGAVHIPWRTDHEPVPNDVCDKRAKEAVGKLLPVAEKLKVSLNIENIFFNGYLMTPGEMIDFVDSFKSERLKVHFDTGNIMIDKFTFQVLQSGRSPSHRERHHATNCLQLLAILVSPASRRGQYPTPDGTGPRVVSAERRGTRHERHLRGPRHVRLPRQASRKRTAPPIPGRR